MMTHDTLDDSTPIKRGPGRPRGSLNKPKPPPLSPIERQALKEELGAVYRQAIIDRALIETHTRGLSALILAKLGKEGLAEIQAEIVREQEASEGAARSPSPPRSLRGRPCRRRGAQNGEDHSQGWAACEAS